MRDVLCQALSSISHFLAQDKRKKPSYVASVSYYFYVLDKPMVYSNCSEGLFRTECCKDRTDSLRTDLTF